MRIGIVNDDMPFLVDSVANAIARRQITIHRLLHPVVCVNRDDKGALHDVELTCVDKDRRELMMYLELDRVDARDRQALAADLKRVLDDVRLAVRDWPKLQGKMREDARAVSDAEGAALLDWFANGAMTLLGYQVEKPYEAVSGALGIFSIPGAPTDEGGCLNAMRYLDQGGDIPLMAKAERKSTVHRRVPLDLVVVPLRENGKVTGIGVHAGLWTSEGLRVPPEEVPVLRRRLERLDEDFGFDPKGHSGKALRHAVASLPRDLLITIDYEAMRDLVMMAMSLADRPRPALLQVRSILKGQLFTLRVAAARGAYDGSPDRHRQPSQHEGGTRHHQLVGRAWRRRSRADSLHAIYRRGCAASRRRSARRGGRRNGSRMVARGRGRAHRRRRRGARHAPRA